MHTPLHKARSKAKAIALKHDNRLFIHSFLFGFALMCMAMIVH